jgi:hypothetical protein
MFLPPAGVLPAVVHPVPSACPFVRRLFLSFFCIFLDELLVG